MAASDDPAPARVRAYLVEAEKLAVEAIRAARLACTAAEGLTPALAGAFEFREVERHLLAAITALRSVAYDIPEHQRPPDTTRQAAGG